MILFMLTAVIFCTIALEISFPVKGTCQSVIKLPKRLNKETNVVSSPSQMFIIAFVVPILISRFGIVKHNQQLFTLSIIFYLYILIGSIGTCYSSIEHEKIRSSYVYCGALLGIATNLILLYTNTIQSYGNLVACILFITLYLIVSLFLNHALQAILREPLGFMTLASCIFPLTYMGNFLIVSIVVFAIEYVIRKLITHKRTKQFKLSNKMNLGVSLSISLLITLIIYISTTYFI